MNTTCLHCSHRAALPREDSVLQLCQRCLNALFPGSDTAAYERLVQLYGYEECQCGTCYSCRRQAIDATALRIVEREQSICAGMMSSEKLEAHAWGQANLYRCNAINALAFEMIDNA